MPIAIDGSFQYKSGKFSLQPGDSVLLYTDGLEDAQDEQGTRYTIKPSIEIIGGFSGKEGPKDINDALLSAVTRHIGDANQFDDITMITVKYYGK